MKKLNSKGFTLVELLAVIIILAVIVAIAVPTVSDIIKSSKQSSLNDSAGLVLKTAEQKAAIAGLGQSSYTLATACTETLNLGKEYGLTSVACVASTGATASDCTLTFGEVAEGSLKGFTAEGTYTFKNPTGDSCSATK